jgi:hypothetical protein
MSRSCKLGPHTLRAVVGGGESNPPMDRPVLALSDRGSRSRSGTRVRGRGGSDGGPAGSTSAPRSTPRPAGGSLHGDSAFGRASLDECTWTPPRAGSQQSGG